LNCRGFALLVAAAAALISPAFAACSVGAWTDDFAPERCNLQDDAIVVSCSEKENSDACGMRLSEQREPVGAGNFSMTLKAAPGKGVVTSFYLSNSQPLVKMGFDIFGGAVKPGNSQIWISLLTGLRGEHNQVINVPFDTTAEFHTYTLDLTPTTIRYLVDGVLYHTLDISAVGKAKSSIELKSLRRHISLWGKTVADRQVNCEPFMEDTQANCEQFVGMQGKLGDNVNQFPVHASFKPQWKRAASRMSATSMVSPISTTTATLQQSMNAADVTSTVLLLASTAAVNKEVEWPTQQRQQQQQQHGVVEGSSTSVRDNLPTASSTHGEVQPRSTEAASSSPAVVPAAAAASPAPTTPFFTSMGMLGKATSVAVAAVATSTEAINKTSTTQPVMEVAVPATVYSSRMAVATQAAATIPPAITTTEAMPARAGGTAAVPPEVAASKGTQSLDNTQAALAGRVAAAATAEGTTTISPSATDDSIATPAVVLDDQTEVAVDVLQRLVSNSALDMTGTSIPVMLAVAGAIVSVLGAFVAWRKIRSQWQLCYQALEEPRRCMLDPELLA
jgi:hypothetical protein